MTRGEMPRVRVRRRPEPRARMVFEEYPPEDVLGVQYGKNSFGVFVADTVAPDEQERILAALSGNKH